MGVIKRQGIKNTIITYIGIIIGAVNIVFIQPKFLSEEELGLTRLLYDFAYMVSLLLPLGLPGIIVKYFPFFKDKEKGHNGFAVFSLALFFAGFVISTILLLVFKPDITRAYETDSKLFVDYFNFIIPFSFVVSGILATSFYCQALFKSTVPTFLNDICIRVGIMLITILYFNKLISFDEYIYSFIGIYALELVILLIFILVIDKISFTLNKELFKQHPPKQMLRFGLIVSLASFASIALRKIDAVILGTVSLKLVGVYTTAIFIASFIEVPLGALEKITHTKIADSFAKGRLADIEKIYKDSVKYLLLAGGLLFAGMNACTKYIYQIGKLPQSYLDCVDVVYIVGLGALINISTGVNSSIVSYSRYYVLGTVLMIVTLVITIILNVLLIPVYGIYGAAIASMTAAILYNLIKFVFIYLKFGFQPYTGNSLVIFLVIVGCTVLAHVLPETSAGPLVNLLYKGAVVSGLYLLLLYYLKLAPEIFKTVFSKITAVIR